MRKLLTGALLALTPLCAYAQTQTQIIASGAIKNAGSVISVGTVSITGADENGQAIPYSDGDGNAHGTAAVLCKIVAGQITGVVQPDNTVSGTCTVPNSLMVPGGIYLQLQHLRQLDRAANEWEVLLLHGCAGCLWRGLGSWHVLAETANDRSARRARERHSAALRLRWIHQQHHESHLPRL